jgi:hypothetical protein
VDLNLRQSGRGFSDILQKKPFCRVLSGNWVLAGIQVGEGRFFIKKREKKADETTDNKKRR